MTASRPTPSNLAERVAFVTGAARGIGFSTAQALTARGITVVMTDSDADTLVDASRELAGSGALVHSIRLDVCDPRAVGDVVERVEREIGPIEFLVNVAGVLHTGSLLELSVEDWEHSFAVNTHGVFHVSQAVARRMVTRRRGSIVTVASNAGHTPRVGMGAYPATKAAAIQFMRCLGLELAAHGIRCNTVSPGSTDTPMQRALWQDEQAEQRVITGSLESHRLGIPLGRLAEASDIADAILFLLSEQARHITLHDLRIDGGATF